MSSIRGEIIIRPCENKDEQSIAELLHNNYPNTPDPASIHKTWCWQFKNNFTKASGVAIAELEGNIVAQYAVMWLPMIYKGRMIEGAVSTATVTDKSARGRGLFTKLASKVYQDIASSGAKIVYGFPNSQSIHGFLSHLDWFEVAPFPLCIKLIDTSAIFRKFIGGNASARLLGRLANFILHFICGALHPVGRNGSLVVRKVVDIPDALDNLWEKSFIAQKIALVRHKKYLHWRYLEKPFFSYDIYIVDNRDGQIGGCIITSTSEKSGMKIIYVMELFTENNNQRLCQALLDKLVVIATEQDADAISLLSLPDDPFHTLYRRNGYFPVPRRLFPQEIYFGARLISEDIDPTYARDKHNWYISWGDMDVV
jgi:hypothetical protein